MDYFVTETSLDGILDAGADGFTETVRSQVLTYRLEAQTEMIGLLEASLTNGIFNGSGRYRFRTRRRIGITYTYSPSEERRSYAKTIYNDIREGEQSEREYQMLQRAESLLCLYKALPIMALRPTKGGGLVDSVSVTKTTTRLLPFGKLASYRREIYGQARDLVKDALFEFGLDPNVTYAL